MFDSPSPTPFEPSRARRELARLVRRIQALTLELAELRRHGEDDRELQKKERALEQLRWQLAAVSRRYAADDLGNAA